MPGFGSYHFAVLGLSPVARGRGVRTAAAPCSALTGRQGVEGGAGAGRQPRVRTVQQAFPALLLQALVHPLQLEVTYHVWGTARGPRREKILQRRPPRREGRGREPGGPLLSPDRRYQPAGARCCAGQRQHQPDRGVPAASPPPALALPARPPPPSGVPGEGKRSPIPPPSPAGTRPGTRGSGRGGPAGRERWARGGRDGDGTGVCRARPQAAPPAASRRLIYPERVGGSRGAPSPSPGPPALSRPHVPGRFPGTERVRRRPPALSLLRGRGSPRAGPAGEGCPHTPLGARGLQLPSAPSLTAVRVFPQVMFRFPLRSDFCNAPRLGKRPPHIHHAVTGPQLPSTHSLIAVPSFPSLIAGFPLSSDFRHSFIFKVAFPLSVVGVREETLSKAIGCLHF